MIFHYPVVYNNTFYDAGQDVPLLPTEEQELNKQIAEERRQADLMQKIREMEVRSA